MALSLEELQKFFKSDFKNAIIILLIIGIYLTASWGIKTQDKYDTQILKDIEIQRQLTEVHEKLFYKQIEITQAWKEINAVTSKQLYERYGIKNDSPFDADSMATPSYPKRRQ